MTRLNRHTHPVLYLRKLASALACKLKVFTKFMTNKSPNFVGDNRRSLYFVVTLFNLKNSNQIQISNQLIKRMEAIDKLEDHIYFSDDKALKFIDLSRKESGLSKWAS